MPKIIRQKRYIYSCNGEKQELCPGIPIKGAKVIPASPERIAKVNRELTEKCRKHRENDAEALIWAKAHGCC